MKSTIPFLTLALLSVAMPVANAQVFIDVLEQVTPAQVPFGGLTESLAVNPTDIHDVIAGTGRGGMYRSHDSGAHWSYVASFPADQVLYVTFCPTDANVILASTYGNRRIARDSGVWRSTDGGKTWSQPPTSLVPVSDRCADRSGAYGISWLGTRVWVGTECGLLQSNDRGATWTNTTFEGISSSDRIYAVTAIDAQHIVAGGAGGYFYMHDGATWHASEGAAPNFLCVRGLAVSPVEHSLLFRADWEIKRLQYSEDGGITWRNYPQEILLTNMPPFVRTAGIPGSTISFELYVGDGKNLWHGRIQKFGSRWILSPLTQLAIAHYDPGDLLFYPVTERPYLLAGDGGVMNTKDGGQSWQMVGAGPAGLNALEVYGVTVQNVEKPTKRTDVAFTTWHNETWVSSDGGSKWNQIGPDEASGMSASGPKLNDGSEEWIAMQPWTGSGEIYAALLAGTVPLAPHVRHGNVCYQTSAFFLNPADGKWNVITASRDCEGSGVIYDRRTPGSDSWKELARSSAGTFLGFPRVAVREKSVTLYQFATKDGGDFLVKMNVTDGNVIRSAAMRDFGPSVTVGEGVRALKMSGTGSVAHSGYNLFEPVWAVKPDDERVLIAAETVNGRMMMSTDGGDDWTDLPELTDLVTNKGALQFQSAFNRPPEAQVTTIAFDPYDTNHIVVGTMSAGLFHSRNGGASWLRVRSSDAIPNITSVAFSEDRTVWIGSGGRGLWTWQAKPFKLAPGAIKVITDDAPPVAGEHRREPPVADRDLKTKTRFRLPPDTVPVPRFPATVPRPPHLSVEGLPENVASVSAAQGTSLRLNGRGFFPGQPVTILVNGQRVGTATPDDHGAFRAEVQLLTRPGAGALTVTQRADGREVTAQQPLFILDDDHDARR
ncbi:MAG: hypothetical protein QOF63_256 [Thermoanaerobaculia bacterium]|nr:hypothetical protein [Thermoanaerobaculia bacterium]